MNEKNKNGPASSAWPINFDRLKCPPLWLTSLILVIGSALALFLILISIVALWHLGLDVLGPDPARGSDAIKSLLPAIAAAVGLPLIIWRLAILNRQTATSEAKTEIDRETLYSSIFSRSIDQLGQTREVKETRERNNLIEISSRTAPNIEVRLGAIYSLDRILRDSSKDRMAILETLCAYIRENAPIVDGAEHDVKQTSLDQTPPKKREPRIDIQAALTVIGRRPIISGSNRPDFLDISNTDLSGYDFSTLNFSNAMFHGAILNQAGMIHAKFSNASFFNTQLRSSQMLLANFERATFSSCDLSKADISETNFRNAEFTSTDLRPAKVASMHIEGADFEQAFGYGLEYAVEDMGTEKPSLLSIEEILGIDRLFSNATCDEHTRFSDPIRSALLLATSLKQASAGSTDSLGAD